MRVCSPPIRHQCFFGVDMARRDDLIASRMDIESIRKHIGADSLGYLSLEGLRDTARRLKRGFCDACFSDEYPVPIEDAQAPPQLSLFHTAVDEVE
jgi:amidophosphoribosyltransferase